MNHLPWKESLSDDNLHLIAISNLEDNEYALKAWWRKKYKIPEKPLYDYTIEEIFIEMMSDYYQDNPAEKQKFLFDLENRLNDWDGQIQYDEKTTERLKKFHMKHKVDISKWQSDDVVDEKDIIESLGRNLPGSKIQKDGAKKVSLLGGAEFEDNYT